MKMKAREKKKNKYMKPQDVRVELSVVLVIE